MKQIGILNQAAQRTYLLRLLVKRNIRNQYYGSFIGVLWTVLNPLLNMLVMAFVFSQIFGRDGIELDYAVYVLSGNIIFNVMRASTSGSLPCLVNQRNLLQKNKISVSIFPISNVLSSLVTFGFSFIALVLVMVVRILMGADVAFHWEMLMTVVLLPSLLLFSLGISLFLSTLYVFFRDIQHIYSVLLTLWTYLTPLFYTVDKLNSPMVTKVMAFNPMYHYVEYFRTLLMGGMPSLAEHLICYGFGIVFFLLGLIFMRLTKNSIAARL